MNLEKHISELLYRYQCVAVPSFGAFLTENVSAQLFENSNSFYPPKKLIVFNANLKTNDGLLANQIASVEKCSYEKAVDLINIEVDNWRNSLNSENNLYLKNIGSISMNFDKNMVFTPTDNFNYLTSSFGLTTFVSPNIKRVIAEAKNVFEPDFENIQSQNSVAKSVNEEVIAIRKPRSYSNLKYAAVFIVGCGIASPVFLNLYKEKVAINNLIVEAKVQKQVQNKIQEATFFISNNPLPEVANSLSNDIKLNYHVVAGAFKVEANADKICENLILKGYKAEKITQNINGLFPVIYNSYATYSEARKAMNLIQINDNPDAWVLIQQLDK
jgi:CCDC81-like prokaryotic HU domain 2/CCDC81-like prokaryotic HU domain 1/SPOR domain